MEPEIEEILYTKPLTAAYNSFNKYFLYKYIKLNKLVSFLTQLSTQL